MQCRLDYRRYALRFRTPLRTAHGPWAVREGVLLRLNSDTGRIGWAEVAPISAFRTESLDEALLGLSSCGGTIDADLLQRLPSGLRCTRGALRLGLRLAGGEPQSEAPDAEASHFPVAALLPAGRAALSAIEAKVDAGYRHFKWKVGMLPPAEELPLLDDLLSRLPAKARLRVDANGAWDRRQAEAWLVRCAERPVEFIEQPIAPECRHSTDLLLGLASDYPTPIALDESVCSDADVDRWLDHGWSGFWVLKTALLENPDEVLVRLAARNCRVVFSSSLQTAIGTWSEMHRMFGWKGERFAAGFGVWPLFEDNRFDGGTESPWLHLAHARSSDPETLWNALS